MGSVIAMLGLVLAAPAMLNREFPRELRKEAGNPMYNHYRCQDDRWIAMAHAQPNRYWPKVCAALGLEELIEDPRFSTIEARGKKAKELVSIFDEKFATKPRHEWLRILGEAGCICTPVQTPTEVCNDIQAMANEYLIYTTHPEHGKMKMVGFPWQFSDTPASCRLPAPGLGQHSEEILTDLGYSTSEIAGLREEQVI
jgi:crotonobetainyl-CoA:carnitine CoA-transferase CaiB-like acyl-CoA transferase